jgi:hypothetical protein
VTSQFAGDDLYIASNDSDPFQIKQEDARATYTGPMLVFGSSTTATSVTVPLRATIQDITALPSDPAYDANAGNIMTAKVYFVNRDVIPNAILCTASLALIDPSDSKSATATCNTVIQLNNQASQSVTIGIVVGQTATDGNYTRNSSDDNTVVTASQPLSSQFITGGGYLVLSSQMAGLMAGDVGSKNNFGFNVKYNSKGTNLQGRVNTIIRRTENGVHKVYQVKANNLGTLGVTYCKVDATTGLSCTHDVNGSQVPNTIPPSGCTYNATATCPIKATFTGSASIQDVTNPLAPLSVDGGATVQLDMFDYGEPGSTGPGPDQISITVWNKSNALWYSSRWNSTAKVPILQLLDGGNLVAH